MTFENVFGVTAAEILADALMMRKVRELVLVVEGQTDENMLCRHVARSQVGVVIAHGKLNALQAATALDDADADSTIAVLVDRDQGVPDGVSRRVITTEAWDLDSEVFAFTDVLAQAHLNFMKKPIQSGLSELRCEIASIAAPITALLIVSNDRRLGLKVSKISLSGIDRSLSLSDRAAAVLAQAIQRRRGEFEGQFGELVSEMEAIAAAISGCISDHQGHILHNAVSDYFRGKVRPKDVQSFTWAALAQEDLRNTTVGQKLEEWASACGTDVWAARGSAVAA